MARATFTPKARDDLRQIGRYAQRQWGVAQRRRYIDTIRRRCEQVADNPRLGRSRDDLRPGYRSIRIGRHIIFYRETAGGVEIIRILHDAMDIPARLRDA